jgi:hypothetical protein
VRVDRLDRALDRIQREHAVFGLGDRLRLDRAQHRRAAAFELEGMRFHADDVFVAALAVGHQCEQVRLRAAGNEQPGLETKIASEALLQMVDGRIVAVDIVADFGVQHRFAHRQRWPGDGIAAQVDPLHGRNPDWTCAV